MANDCRGNRRSGPGYAHDREGLRERRRVRNRRTRPNHRRIIRYGPVHVRDRPGKGARSLGRKPPTLDGGQMLPHAVQIGDRNARVHQCARSRDLVLERKPWSGYRQQRGRAAGQQDDQRTAWPSACRARERPAAGCFAGAVWRWVRGVEPLETARKLAARPEGRRQCLRRRQLPARRRGRTRAPSARRPYLQRR